MITRAGFVGYLHTVFDLSSYVSTCQVPLLTPPTTRKKKDFAFSVGNESRF
jgi:hypothetical protein